MSSFMSSVATPVVHYVLYAAILAAVGVAVPFVKRGYAWLLSVVPAKYRPLLKTWASEAVQYAEQYAGSTVGQDKFAYAVQHVLAIATSRKINIPLQEIQGAIQDAYNALGKAYVLNPHKAPVTPPHPVTAPTQPNTATQPAEATKQPTTSQA